MAASQLAGRPIEPEDAIKQIAYLRDLLESTRLRLANAYPVFLIWGFVWVAGYLAQFGMGTTRIYWLGWFWLAFVAMGTIGQLIWASRFRRRAVRPTTTLERQLFRMELALFLCAIALPLAAGGGRVYLNLATYFPFLVGVGYILAGVFLGRALVGIGAWIAAAAVVASVLPDPMRWLWMAAAGGGGLIFSGILLRRKVRRS
jgi:hypothetical protein